MKASKVKIRYALRHPQDREGEFMFLTSTQSHVSRSLRVVREELESLLDPENAEFTLYDDDSGGDRAPTRKEIIEEYGGIPKIYKLVITEL